MCLCVFVCSVPRFERAMKAQQTARQFLQSFLDSIRERVPSVMAVLVCDSDGVVLLRSVSPSSYQENSLDGSLAAVYAAATQQASKLQFGLNRAVVAWQKDRAVVYVNATPFFATVVCTKESGDVGALLAMVPQIVKALEPMKDAA